jgi:hypothetical protein
MQWLLIILVAVHLVAVNLAGAGPLVAMWMEWRGTRRNRPELWDVAHTLAKCSLAAAGVGVALGLLALAAITTPDAAGGHTDYTSALKQVTPDRWWFTGAEVVFYLVCMTAYVVLLRRPQLWRWVHRTLAIAAGTNLLYHFPALFTILAIVPTRLALIGVPLERSLYRQLLVDPETLARVAHVWLATGWIGWRQAQQAAGDSVVSAATSGGRLALITTMLQIPVGVWVLMTLPQAQQDRLLGGDPLCSALLGISILASLALMHQLAMLALGDNSRSRLITPTALMGGVILLMTAALQCARS